MSIHPSELEARFEAGSPPFVLDIRPAEAYRSDAIDGSHNVPAYGSLREGDTTPLEQARDELPEDEEIVVVCKQGFVAKRGTRFLNDEGYEAVTLAGGMGGWNGYQNGTVGYRLRSLLWRLLP